MREGPLRRWLPIVPALTIFTGLFLLPGAFFFVVSFWTRRSYTLVEDFSFASYQRTVENYGDLLLYTLAIALATAAVCVVLGFLFAYALRFHAGRFADLLIVVTLLTLFGGYLVKIYAWKSILGADGVLNSGLRALGIVQQPVAAFIYNPGAVVVALVNFLLPFAVLPIYAGLRNVKDVTVEAARDLGAGFATLVFTVLVPQLRQGLIAAFTFTFLMAAGDYVTPMFLGGSSGSMLGQFIASEFSTRFNWPAGAAMSVSLLLTSGLIIFTVSRLLGRPPHARL